MEALLLTRRDAAATLSISVRQLDRLIAKGELRAAHLNSSVLILSDDLRAFVRRLVESKVTDEKSCACCGHKYVLCSHMIAVRTGT